MKIAVCVKWVPVVSRLRFDAETKRIVRDGVPSELNGYDVLSVQRAVELKASHGAEVSVYTMGPPNARDGLVRSLAMGAERAFHIVDAAFAGADTLATSRALALALAKESYDLILFGNFSLDAETGQVGPEVAEFLGLPQITAVAALDLVPNPGGAKPGSVAEFTVRAERLLEDGTEVVEADLPVVVSVAEGIAPETFPGRDAIREAAEREITEITAADLAVDHAIFGAAGSPTSVAEIRIIESEREQRVIEDTEVGEAAKQVVAFLRERGVLDPARRPGARERRSRPPAPPTVRGPGGPQTWVVAELGRDGVRAVTHELLAAAQPVADAVHGPVVAVLIGGRDVGAHADELGAAGADVVAVAAGEALASYSTDAYAATLAAAIGAHEPYAVLVPSTPNGRDLAARVAARLELGLTGDIVGLEVDGDGHLVQLKPAFGGNVVAPIRSRTLPNMATVRPGIFEALEPDPSRSPRTLDLDVAAQDPPRVRTLGMRPAPDGDAAALDAAWAVVCVGMGVGGPAHIAELDGLRDALEAQYACTRDVADVGWMPKQLQVGLTGRSIAPALYVGVGVRGDFNHTVGIKRAGTVVIVNNNRRATFFKQADIGVVADWHDFVPALVRELRSAMGHP